MFQYLLILQLATSASIAAEPKTAHWPQWRGPSRNAVSNETGLLKSWESQPPKLVWQTAGLGVGYASIVTSNGTIYTIGRPDKDVFAFALEATTGSLKWKRKIGSTGRIPCSTPTIDGDHLYALDPDGHLFCLKTATGDVVWQTSFFEDFAGRLQSGRGYNESPLIDGDRLICTPGGEAAMLAALDKFTGKVVWKASMPDIGVKGRDGAGFSSVVITEVGGIRQYVQLVGRGVIGIAANDGRFLWGYNKIANRTANIPTPSVRGDLVFAANGYNAGSVLLKLVPDGKGGIDAKEVYFLNGSRFQNHHGGSLILGDSVYGGHGSNNGLPTCLDLKTGKVRWKRRGPGVGSAAIVYADGRLYFRYQNGVMALIEATTDGYRPKGTFQIPGAGGDSWAHPVVAGGRLFLREKDTLLVYDVSDRGSATGVATTSHAVAKLDRATFDELIRLGAKVETLDESTLKRMSQRRRQIYRLLTNTESKSKDAKLTTQTVRLQLTDRHIDADGSIKAPIRALLRKLTTPLALSLAGTQINDAGFDRLQELKNIIALDLELCTRLTDSGLTGVSNLTNLKVLILTGTTITDTGLENIKPLTKLVALDLEVCEGITSDGLKHVIGLKQLRALILKKTGFGPNPIRSAGLAHLRPLTKLTILDLYGNGIKDDGLVHLRGLTQLNTLDLSLTGVTDAGLVHLRELKNLEQLDLLFSEGFAGPMITDQGLKQIGAFAELRSLTLVGARVTDSGLDDVIRLAQLRELNLVGTQVTKSGVARLNRSLTNCRVKR